MLIMISVHIPGMTQSKQPALAVSVSRAIPQASGMKLRPVLTEPIIAANCSAFPGGVAASYPGIPRAHGESIEPHPGEDVKDFLPGFCPYIRSQGMR